MNCLCRIARVRKTSLNLFPNQKKTTRDDTPTLAIPLWKTPQKFCPLLSARLKPSRERGIACNNLRLKPAETQSIKRITPNSRLSICYIVHLNMTHSTLNLKNERTMNIRISSVNLMHSDDCWKYQNKDVVEASLGSAIKYPIRDSQQQACLTGHDSVKGTPPIGSLENARHVSFSMTQCLLTRECLTTNYYGRKGNGVLWMTLNWEWFCFWFWGSKAQSFALPQNVSQWVVWVVGADC